VVGVGVGGGPVAAGRGAFIRACPDEVLEFAADDVPVGVMTVIAVTYGDRGELYPQAAQ
jgi:hypothetical protein